MLLKTLLPKGTKLFTRGKHISWVLQQDGDRSHGAAGQVLAKWNNAHAFAVQLLPNWPPSSHDLNIIENVWGLLQQNVNQLGCKDFAEFQKVVHDTFGVVPLRVMDNMYNSLKGRMEQVVVNGGGYTKY